jgi:PAS domain S-box-containing protein
MAQDALPEASSRGHEPEATTHNSGRLWRQVLDSLPVGVAVMDTAGNILLVNAASSRIWGGVIHSASERYPRSKAFVHGTGEPLPPDAWGSVRALTRGETSVNELLDIETLDGRRKTIQNSAAPIRDDAGAIVGAVVINEDVTERVRAEQALRKSESMLREAEALGRTGSWEWELATGEVRGTEENRRLFFGDDLTKGATIDDYVATYHPEDRERLLEDMGRGRNAGVERVALEFRIVWPDGSVRWILGHRQTVRDATGRAVRLYGTNTDITERRVAEQELARRSREQAAIAQLSLHALSADSMAALFDEAAALVASTLGLETCLVMEATADDSLIVRARAGPDAATVGAETSGVTVPIPGKTAPFGALRAITTAQRKLGPEEVRFVFSIASALATSIEQRRTTHELDEKRDRLQALSRRLLDAQEAERRAVARELHDDLGAMLTAIKLNLQRKDWAAPEVRLESLDLVDQAVKQMRELALDLRPSILDDLGLAEAVRWYAGREAQRAGLGLELALEDVGARLQVRVATACFRLVQEALTNVVRHAAARNVAVALRGEDASVVMEVRDDGRGFDAVAALRAASAGKSQGLLSMQERAELAGGVLSIDSLPGKGTVVRAAFPLPPGAGR